MLHNQPIKLLARLLALGVAGVLNAGVVRAQSTTLFYEDFGDATLAANSMLFVGGDSTAVVENGVAKINDIGDRSGFSVVQGFDEPLMTFQFDFVENIVPTNALRMEVILRAGIGDAQRTLGSTEQVIEAITFRGTDAAGSRIGEGIQNKTLFMVYNNKDTQQTFPSPIDGTDVLLNAYQYVPYTYDRTAMTFTTQPKGVSNGALAGSPGPAPADITRFAIGSSTSGDNGTFAIDNVLVRSGVFFDRSFPPVTPTAIPGDFDGDVMVDADDLALWKARFGSTTPPLADADGDIDTDGDDFMIWQRNFGKTSPASAAGAAIPEPSGIVLAALGLLATMAGARRSRG